MKARVMYRGKTPYQCQDFAAAKVSEAKAIAALADGCSGSSDRVDQGAKLVTSAALALARLGYEATAINRSLPFLIERWRVKGGMTPKDMEATSGFVLARGNNVTATMVGDGAILVILTDGSVICHEISWTGLTFYPIYSIGREEEFLREGSQMNVSAIRHKDGKWAKRPAKIIMATEAMHGYTLAFDRSKVKAVAVASDGLFDMIARLKTTLIEGVVPFLLEGDTTYFEGVDLGDDLSIAGLVFEESRP